MDADACMSDSKSDNTPQAAQPEAVGEAATAPRTSPPHAASPENRTTAVREARAAVGAPLWLGLASLAIALALAVAGLFFWDRQHQILDTQSRLTARIDARLANVDNVINRVQSGFDQFKGGEESRRLAVEGRMDRLDEGQRDQGLRLENLSELVGRGSREWALAEVDFLLTLANRSVQLQRDRTTARAALASADDALRVLDDPAYLVVRERIAAEIAALDAVPAIDRAGLASGLEALMAQIDRLPLQGHPATQAAGGETVEGEESAPPAMDWKRWDAWKRLPGVMWDAVRQLVRIREHDRPVEPMVAPDKEYFLRQNLRLQLESARLALLREAPVIYRQALETARAWIADYFDAGDSSVAAMRERLTELALIDVRPELPDISGSLNALRQQQALASARSVATGGEPAPAASNTLRRVPSGAESGATDTAP